MSSPDGMLADALSRFYADPLGYVMFNWEWNSERSIQLVPLPEKYKNRFPNCQYGPDAWACEFLDELGSKIKENRFDGHTPVPTIKCATASGHGIGKSALVAWLVKFILDTRPLSVGTVTANTAEQLKVKTWAEVGKWHHLSLTRDWFHYSSGRGAMSLVYKDRNLKWRCDAQTCKEENSEAFAGQHSPTATSFYIFDEASNIPEKIYEVREGGLSDGEPMVFDFGNPTRNTGSFFENCVGRFKHRYTVRCIDSRSVAITNKLKHAEDIEDYGLDSDYVKVRILGQFPSMGNVQYIPTAAVEAAMLRDTYIGAFDPLVLGVDVARFGDNDTVIYPRIGNDARSWPIDRYNGLDVVAVVDRIAEKIQGFKGLNKPIQAVFVDGGGIGGGVVDVLRRLNYPVYDVGFGNTPTNRSTYRFKGDEIWGRMKEAIETSLMLPTTSMKNALDLKAQLTQREYGYTDVGHKISLERKKDMAERGVGSPDVADALALTFALDVHIPDPRHKTLSQVLSDYDPLQPSF